MARNSLDRLIPFLTLAAQQVGRELIGAIPAATMDMTAESAAYNQEVRVPVTPKVDAERVVIGVDPVVEGQVFGDVVIKMDKMYRTSFMWDGEEELGLGGALNGVRENQIMQGFRTLANQIETDVFAEAINGAEGGNLGVAGTPPFESGDMREFAQLVKMFNDAGSPQYGRQLVLNTTAAASLRNKPNLWKANEAGETGLLRQGVFANIMGFDIRESGGATQMTIGGVETLPNAAFTRDAVLLAARAIRMPEGGDKASDVTTVTDTVSGLTFGVASYPGYKTNIIELSVLYGVKTINPQNAFVLLG